MTPLTVAQATAMLDLQDRLNVLDDPAWEKKNYLRRAWIATGDLLDVIEGGSSTTVSVMFAEVWRHLMSEWLKNIPKDETLLDGAALLVSAMYEERFWSATQDAVLQKHHDLPVLADAFAHMCTAGMFNAKLFERMMELWNMSWHDMYTRIVPEGVAEVFTRSLPPEGCSGEWVYEWALGVADSSLTQDVVTMLNMLEQAYVVEVARRTNEVKGT